MGMVHAADGVVSVLTGVKGVARALWNGCCPTAAGVSKKPAVATAS